MRLSGIAAAGLGAFALIAFKEGQVVGKYRCTTVPKGFQNTRYSWKLPVPTHSCDSTYERLNNPMRYVNSIASSDSCDKLNVRAVPSALNWLDPEAGKAYVPYMATRDIRVGDE